MKHLAARISFRIPLLILLFSVACWTACEEPEVLDHPLTQQPGEPSEEGDNQEGGQTEGDKEEGENPDGNKDPKPDPETPDPENPDPNPEPEIPDPEIPNPHPEPNPEPNPDPHPNPEPNPEQPGPQPELPKPEGGKPTWKAGRHFAPGVTEHSGWYDVNKKRDGMSDGDFLLCWAATAANLLQWWQDYYQSKGYSLPAGAPNGKGSYYELAIFEAMKPNFENRGCDSDIAVHWYFTGEDRGANIQNFPHPKPGTGGYYKDIFPEIAAKLGGMKAYCQDLNGYDLWGNGRTDPRPSIDIFSEYLQTYLPQGAMGMTLRTGFSSLHAVTLWGCDVDEQGRVTAVWFTDSDDQMSTPSAPRVQKIHHLSVRGEEGKIFAQNHFCGNPQIVAISPLKAYPPVQ